MTYATPFIDLKPQEISKLGALIRKTYKAALGLPTYTSNEKLLRLGLHNTLQELIEAQRNSQLHRLTLTPTGRRVLKEIGRPDPNPSDLPQRIPLHIRKKLKVAPVPKHMHPTFNRGRREARVRQLTKKYAEDSHT